MMYYSLILACTLDGGIGIDNSMAWYNKDEINLFKKITSESTYYLKKNAVIMGKNTWNSLPYKPLNNRYNIVLTSNPSEINQTEYVKAFTSLEYAFDYCDNNILIDNVFIIGGEKLYNLCLNYEKYSSFIKHIHLSVMKKKYNCNKFINLKHIIQKYRYYNINDIIFNSDFIYLKFINSSKN